MAEVVSADIHSLKMRVAEALQVAEAKVASGTASPSEQTRAATLRLVSCAVRDRDASARTRGECDGCPDATVRGVLETMAAQRRISSKEFDEAGRIEDAEREREELSVIEEFLPKPLGEDELNRAVKSVVDELDASTLKDLGKCMSTLKARYPGKIDSRAAGQAVRRALQ
ncbi:MAG: GatB/YqeY domain-containing protein [Pseudomonadota bacterium]